MKKLYVKVIFDIFVVKHSYKWSTFRLAHREGVMLNKQITVVHVEHAAAVWVSRKLNASCKTARTT